MQIIGRGREKDILSRCLHIERPQFIAIYGRRRVGKTYLVKEFFNNKFSFYSTGITQEKTAGQLHAFYDSLEIYGDEVGTIPKDWFEAFSRLRKCLSKESVYRDPVSGKRVVFLDELPWMDTQRSNFRSALEYFWNSWGSSQPDLILIVCGSATSWMVKHLLDDHGGFHNRITKRIHLMPFSLLECEQLCQSIGMDLPRSQIIEYYMIFGGIPHYMTLMDERLSLVQNVDELCFKSYGELHNEYNNVIRSLFKKPEKHLAIMKALYKTKRGMTRQNLSAIKEIGGGSVLTKNLEELEQSGFIRQATLYSEPNNIYYQLIDPFSIFSLHFMQQEQISSWTSFFGSPGYYAWRGNAFELVCLHHIEQLKTALGIRSVETHEAGWQSFDNDSRAQIDLLIDRKDGVINLCEMKYTDDPFEITKIEHDKLKHRLSVFKEEEKPNKAVHITLISANGFKQGPYNSVAQNFLTGDDLFRF